MKTNKRNTWGIVDEDGKIIEKYRCKSTAIQHISKLQERHLKKLKIVLLLKKNRNI